MYERSRVVRCHGCGGNGKQGPYSPLGFPEDCIVCSGTGMVRLEHDDVWCDRCRGTGREKVGIPPSRSMATCHICGGVGMIKI